MIECEEVATDTATHQHLCGHCGAEVILVDGQQIDRDRGVVLIDYSLGSEGHSWSESAWMMARIPHVYTCANKRTWGQVDRLNRSSKSICAVILLGSIAQLCIAIWVWL